MPNIDPAAKKWELDLAKRVGQAVQRRRNALKLTAQQLAERTAELGYPITRVAISKIEGNKRAGKFDVAELLVLAQALKIPPALLLFPDYPDGPVQGLPGNERKSVEGVWWVSGRRARTGDSGTHLVGLVEQRADTMWELSKLDRLLLGEILSHPEDARARATEAVNRQIQLSERQLEILEVDIRRAKDELWGGTEVGSDE
jgi:transcriptional regulator with XRE-family HTH domain